MAGSMKQGKEGKNENLCVFGDSIYLFSRINL